MIAAAFVVARKEWIDAVRDRRTLLVVLLSSVLLGPLALVALSGLVASFESRADARTVRVHGIEHAPTLANFLARQTQDVVAVPDPAAAASRPRAEEPVLVVEPGFERALVTGEPARLELVFDSSRKTSQASAARLQRLVEAFVRERNVLQLALRGVAPRALQPVELRQRDLATAGSRAAQYTALLPFFVMMAVLYGALGAALDTTAGERERGSLEPLLATPADRTALVIGKWAAVAGLGMLIAVLSCLSFIPAQSLLRSETLQAMFRFGVAEAMTFLAVLLPFACAVSAVLMAVAMRCRSFKEAQASSTLVVLAVSLVPLLAVFDDSGERAWHVWIPALAQNTLMTRVLKGEGIGFPEIAVPLGVCVVIAAAALGLVVRGLRTAAVR